MFVGTTEGEVTMKAVESTTSQFTKSQAANLPGTKSAAIESTLPAAGLPETESAASQSIKSITTDLPSTDSTSAPLSHPSVLDKENDQEHMDPSPPHNKHLNQLVRM